MLAVLFTQKDRNQPGSHWGLAPTVVCPLSLLIIRLLTVPSVPTPSHSPARLSRLLVHLTACKCMCSRLLFPIQWMLLQDLLHLVHSEIVSTDLCNSPDHVLFAVSLYHRWALRVLYNSTLLSKLRYPCTVLTEIS